MPNLQSRYVGGLRSRFTGASPARFFALIFAPLLVLYLATADWTESHTIDALTNMLTAAEVANDGDIYLDDHEILAEPGFQGSAAWVVRAGDTAVAQYPPGTAALAVPAYWLWPDSDAVAPYVGFDGERVVLPAPPISPGAITSATVAAITAGLIGLMFRRFTDDRTAILGAYVAGLGTGLWSVAANTLWQHGPAMMWIAAGTLLSSSHRIWSGLGFGVGILTRPHTALVAAGNGLVQAFRSRSLVPAVQIGSGAALGLGLLVLFNWSVFGSPSISGGYTSVFTERATTIDLPDFLGNVVLALIHPLRGLLVYSPFLVLLIPGLPSAWRRAPAWVQGSALGGVVYLVLQLKTNRYSGGTGFWGYRYPLEMLAATAPLLMLSYVQWLRHRSEPYQRFFKYTLVASVALTTVGAIFR